MEDIDLYVRIWCFKCKKIFLVSGSAPSRNVVCPHQKEGGEVHQWDFDFIHRYEAQHHQQKKKK